MRREKQEHLEATGMIEEKRSKGKQLEKMLDGLTKWLKVGRVSEALKDVRWTNKVAQSRKSVRSTERC